MKNLIKDKLERSYIRLYRIKNVRNIIVKLELLDISIFLKFYVLIIKKTNK